MKAEHNYGLTTITMTAKDWEYFANKLQYTNEATLGLLRVAIRGTGTDKDTKDRMSKEEREKQ